MKSLLLACWTGIGCLFLSVDADGGQPWLRHTIDASSDGADGVRLADLDSDGRLDIATGWEQGGIVRVCLHPGPGESTRPWPAVTVGAGAGPEDAVMADIDGDGVHDVVSCHEGKYQRVLIHFYSGTSDGGTARREDLLVPSNWTTVEITETVGRSRWMYALPMQVDDQHGVDLIVGSKNPNGVVGWLQSPADPRLGDDWKFHPIQTAGWIMTLDRIRSNAPAFIVTDRKGDRRSAFRMDLIDAESPENAASWQRTNLGGVGNEMMFAALLPPDQKVLVSATRDNRWLAMATDPAALRRKSVEDSLSKPSVDSGVFVKAFPNPLGIRSGKAIAVAPYDANHVLLAHTTNTANDGKANKVSGVTWAIVPRQTLTEPANPTIRANLSDRAQKEVTDSDVHWQAMSDTEGVKFDRGEWLDVDEDGDLDFITCEETDNLGVFWYENPER